VDKKKLSFVKTCCVGIGLVKKGGVRPLRIFGSGFFVRMMENKCVKFWNH